MSDITTGKRPTVATVREWTIALGILTAGQMTRADAEMKLRAYVPLLQDEFSPGAFTQASLSYVAAQCKWFPSYADVIGYLRTWWRENRPKPPALPPPAKILPERDPPTPDEIAYVENLVREVTAALRSSALAHEMPELPPRGPRHLTPAQLDLVNPLPNGRKRDGTTRTATVDPDTTGADATGGIYPARDDVDAIRNADEIPF